MYYTQIVITRKGRVLQPITALKLWHEQFDYYRCFILFSRGNWSLFSKACWICDYHDYGLPKLYMGEELEARLPQGVYVHSHNKKYSSNSSHVYCTTLRLLQALSIVKFNQLVSQWSPFTKCIASSTFFFTNLESWKKFYVNNSIKIWNLSVIAQKIAWKTLIQ